MRRAVSFSADIITEPPPQQRNEAPPRDRAAEAAEAALARQPALVRSLSLDVIDSSHIDPIEFGRRRDYLLEKRARGELEGGEEDLSKNKALMVVPTPDDDEEEDGFEGGASPKKPARADNSYSAEEIALRRFMTAVAWGPGMAVLKHNRRKGRVRRLLKFNDQEGYLCWCGTLPPYYKTRIAAEALLNATRAGNLVTVQIANQGDVGFQCARLTDAIVLEVGVAVPRSVYLSRVARCKIEGGNHLLRKGDVVVLQQQQEDIGLSFSESTKRKTDGPMELVDTDLMGPISPAAKGGYTSYVSKFTDYFSRAKDRSKSPS
eukprot:jgi/Undpi1/2701/HiC_scaffold_14.g06079.m1